MTSASVADAPAEVVKEQWPDFIMDLVAVLPNEDRMALESLLEPRKEIPSSPVGLLDLVDERLANEGIASDRWGVDGNPHEQRLLLLKKLYATLDAHFDHPPDSRHSKLVRAAKERVPTPKFPVSKDEI